jgi:tetratricopeptide (TPR) repeat protein/TolB-like protein
MTRTPLGRLLLLLMAVSIALFASLAAAQTPFASDTVPTDGRLILVLPFENKSGQSALSWIGDSFPETLNQRLNSAGFLTITRDDRQFALDHLGLPVDFKPSRATTIRIAQTLDADYVIVGSFNIANPNPADPTAPTTSPNASTPRPIRITVQARILNVNHLRMSPSLDDSSELSRLLDVENAIAWKIARQIDPKFNVALQTFLSSSGGIKLSSFENYIRGIDATTPQERVKRLQQSIQETPSYPAALLALGKTLYIERNYDQAAATLARVPPNDRLALEASFYLGLARFNTAKYSDAEAAFSFVASRLPLPEVVNNQGVSISRQGRDASPLFLRASTADPNDADYHYNLSVSLLRRGDFAGAKREADLTLKLRPTDPEAKQLATRIALGRATPGKDTAAFEPLERIRRTYSEAPFRQAAFQLDQLRAMSLASLPPAERAAQYVKSGRDYLAQGLLPEAEQEFQTAITANPRNPEAHAGLAQVREQSASIDEARAEAQTSIQLKPNAAAYLVLARIDLKQDKLGASASDVADALRIEPTNGAAQGMKQALEARGQSLP